MTLHLVTLLFALAATALVELCPKQARAESAFSPAMPLERKEPRYPYHERRHAGEGWVLLNFCVEPDGRIEQIAIEDSVGSELFKREAIRALSMWSFSPPTINDEPTRQCNLRQRIVFRMHPPADGATRPFVRYYRKARLSLKEGKYEEAAAVVERLSKLGIRNLYEEAHYWILRAALARSRDSIPEELTALNRIVKTGRPYVPRDLLDASAVRLFLLQLEDSDLGGALDTFKMIAEDKAFAVDLKPLKDVVSKVNTVLSSGKPISTKTRLLENAAYTRLFRNSFYFDEISGDVTSIEVRCERKFKPLLLSMDKAWKIPESWGSCILVAEGTQGTTFRVVHQHRD